MLLDAMVGIRTYRWFSGFKAALALGAFGLGMGDLL